MSAVAAFVTASYPSQSKLGHAMVMGAQCTNTIAHVSYVRRIRSVIVITFSRLNINPPASQFRGQPRILTVTANRQAQLTLWYRYDSSPQRFIQLYRINMGWAESRAYEILGALTPCDDVDLFPIQFVDNILDSSASHSNTGSNGIDAFLSRSYSNLRSQPRLSGNRLQFDEAGGHLRYLQLEQAFNQSYVRPRNDELRSCRSLQHFNQVDLQALTGPIVLRGHLFVRQKECLRFAEVDNHGSLLDSLDNTRDKLILAIDERVVDQISLSLTQTLQNDLSGGLGSDAPKVVGGNIDSDGLVRHGISI
jgi:hypothetical protein